MCPDRRRAAAAGPRRPGRAWGAGRPLPPWAGVGGDRRRAAAAGPRRLLTGVGGDRRRAAAAGPRRLLTGVGGDRRRAAAGPRNPREAWRDLLRAAAAGPRRPGLTGTIYRPSPCVSLPPAVPVVASS